MENTEGLIADNKRLWETWTSFHYESAFYDIDGFKKGKDTLASLELEVLGEVQGKSILHLQCHMGLDTLSLARRGALPVGVDISEKSIQSARDLAEELNLEAKFIACNLYDLPKTLEQQFDIVFTSYGTIYWIPDLKSWSEIIFRYLKPGGMFLIVEFHPFMRIFKDSGENWEPSFPYFHKDQPYTRETLCTYAGVITPPRTAHVWAHPLSEVMNSLVEVGLEIRFFKEYPYSTRQYCLGMKQREDGFWIPSESSVDIPCLYALKAIKKIQGLG